MDADGSVSERGDQILAPVDWCAPATIRTPNHEVTLYPDPDPFFLDLERAIEQATRRVWLETYIYRQDAMGSPFAERLLHAAERGLDVRLLYDPQGSRKSSSKFFEHLRRGGVEVRAYRPWRLARRRWTYWPRDHGRNIVVDDVGHTGGINWGVEWLPRRRGGGEWHDVAIAVRGPASRDFAAAFLTRWQEASDTGSISDYAGPEGCDVQLIADSPASTSIVLGKLCDAIQRARERVWIENSYCVPPRALLSALADAARRGVDVQVLVPGISDLPIIQTVTRGEYDEWLKAGLRVSEYFGRVMHSKFALVDTSWATVGTFNAISPGVWWANEINVVLQDATFVDELARVFAYDLLQSSRVTLESITRRPLRARAWERAVASAYRLVESAVLIAQPDPPRLPGVGAPNS